MEREKSKTYIQLQHPGKINIDIYPHQSTLAQVVLYNLASMDLNNIIVRDQKIYVNYFETYFEPNFESRKNLIKFAKTNNDKYNLLEYISENNLSVRRERKKFRYSIILPEDETNEEFFIEYFKFTKKTSLRSFADDMNRLQGDMLVAINKDQRRVREVFRDFEKATLASIDANNVFRQNIQIIMTLYNSRRMQLEENIAFFKSMKNDLDRNWIVDGPMKTIVNEKFHKVIKYVLPVVLSLIIYLLYVFIKLARQDKKY